MRRQRIASIAGITGCLLLLVVVGITMSAYTGWDGERFSIINHFVSELGSKASIRASLFNAALTIVSVLFIPLAVEITVRFRGWQRLVFGLLIFTVIVSIGLLGFFPARFGHGVSEKVGQSDLSTTVIATIRIGHYALAFVFFSSALALFFFSAMVTMFSKQPALPKWTTFVSFLAVIPFAALGVVPRDRLWTMLTDYAHFVRPDFWPLAVVEWLCFAVITVWILVMAAVLMNSVSVCEDRQRPASLAKSAA